MMRRGGSEWHREQSDDDLKYQGDGGSVYNWRDPNKIKVVCDIAFDTLELDEKDSYMYMYTLEGEHYFRHEVTGDYLRTKEV